jgi:hypothetical protein
MGKIDNPKISKPIIRDPEPAGTPIERKDPQDHPDKLEIAERRTSNGRRVRSHHCSGVGE